MSGTLPPHVFALTTAMLLVPYKKGVGVHDPAAPLSNLKPLRHLEVKTASNTFFLFGTPSADQWLLRVQGVEDQHGELDHSRLKAMLEGQRIQSVKLHPENCANGVGLKIV